MASPATASPSTAASPAPFGALPTATLGRAKSAALQKVLDDVVAGGDPDAIAAVITPDGTWSGVAGIGGPDGRIATVRDEFAIASITKTFTAAMVMRLVEQGKMDLDAPLATYLGKLKADANKATVRQTLEMRSGLPDSPQSVLDEILRDPSHVWTAEEIVAGFDPPTAAAGTTYQYSNEAYELLAFAVEHVTGMPFGAALRAELLDPVGAKTILDQRHGVVTPKPWALPTQAFMGSYRPADLGKGGAISNIASATHSIGGASMAGDAPSVAAWAWHLFAGDVLKAESLGQMTPTEAHPYGLGLDRFTDYANVLAYGHSGSKTGYGSILVVFPTTRTVIVVFVNNQDSVVEPIVRDLLAAVQGPDGPRQPSTRITSRRRGPWTPSTRWSSMSLVADGPLIQVCGRVGSRRASASGTEPTTWSVRTTHTWRSGSRLSARRPWSGPASRTIVPVSAIPTAQPVMTPSRPSRSSWDSGGSSTTRSSPTPHSQEAGSPTGVAMRRAPWVSRTATIVAGRSVAVVRWTVAR